MPDKENHRPKNYVARTNTKFVCLDNLRNKEFYSEVNSIARLAIDESSRRSQKPSQLPGAE